MTTIKQIDCSSLDIDCYEQFLKAKLNPFYEINGRIVKIKEEAIEVNDLENIEKNESHLFDYQRFVLNLAIEKKRYAVFADCGLGKTAIFLAWIRRIITSCEPDQKILIISPLMVIQQTLDEEKKFYSDPMITDIHTTGIEEWLESEDRIGITNIDKFHKVYDFGGKVAAVVLDESSILKNAGGKTRTSLIESLKGVPYKLCCSATPAPNDREEYANHAYFLDYVRSNNEFYSRFFVNKDNGWEIKPHGFDAFFKFLSEWSVYLRHPEAYQFRNNIQAIPAPIFNTIDVPWTDEQKKYLTQKSLDGSTPDALEKKIFYLKLSKGFINGGGKTEHIDTNKLSALLEILDSNKGKSTIIWVLYNEEERIIHNFLKKHNYSTKAISGSVSEEDRMSIINDFKDGKFDVLISKTSLVGFGLNMPFVKVQIFNGMDDSYEKFYQSIKRSYRYGATESLRVYITVTSAEKKILNNVLRKKTEFDSDSAKQENYFIEYLKGDLDKFFNRPFDPENAKFSKKNTIVKTDDWNLYNGDSIKVLRQLEKESVDLAVFSPPFASLFTYSNDIADMGNCGSTSMDEFNLHYEFFLKGLYDVIKPGRIVCCHLSQLSTQKSRDGFVGLKDFRGDVIQLFQNAGFIFFGEWVIAKNPQMQAIKEKVRTLSFAQLETDRLGSRPGLNDMILVFKKPGDADRKLGPDETSPTRDEWIEWACGTWGGIRESNTLNVRGTKSDDDVKHICPMNLDVISRCIRMYSTTGETVLDPFNGIGSVGVIALKLKRKYIGIELKPEYFEESEKNLINSGIFKLNEDVNIKAAMKIQKNQTRLI
jgi:DNA modification methylase/late competence protein required for DNA uptake (superfamily II DNA/RNA helicase)